MSLVRLIARPMLASIFISGGISALRHPQGPAARAQPLIAKLSQMSAVPNDPELMVRANGATMALAGAMLATGRMPRVAGGLLAATLVPTTAAGHAFWAESDPQKRQAQLIQFQKNVGLLGGVLLASVDTAGKPGLSWRARNAARSVQAVAKREAKNAKREAKLARAEATLALR